MHVHRLRSAVVACLLFSASLLAQGKPPRAEVTPVAPATPVAPGGSARLTLNVKLPPQYHVQSDKPRDQFLIATALNVKVPAGVTVARTVYPKPRDLAQAGRKEPLAVFGAEFSIEVHLTVAADAAPGDLVIPAQLRYQACDDKVCYAPARADVQWTLRIAATAE
jgi:thiol:disulfide interchange protein DsbD